MVTLVTVKAWPPPALWLSLTRPSEQAPISTSPSHSHTPHRRKA